MKFYVNSKDILQQQPQIHLSQENQNKNSMKKLSQKQNRLSAKNLKIKLCNDDYLCNFQDYYKSLQKEDHMSLIFFLCLIPSLFCLSIIQNLNFTTSSIVGVESIGIGIFYIAKHLVDDHQPLRYYDLMNKSISQINGTQGINTIYLNNNTIFAGQGNKLISIDIKTYSIKVVGTVGTRDKINGISIYQDYIYTVDFSGQLCKWRYPTQFIYCKMAHAFNATIVDAINNNFQTTTGQDRNLKFWNYNGQNIVTKIFQSEILYITHSDQYVAVGNNLGVIKLYDIGSFAQFASIKVSDAVVGIKIFEIWDLILVALKSGVCKVFDMKGQLKQKLDSHSTILSVSWQETGFVTGHKNGDIKIWKY